MALIPHTARGWRVLLGRPAQYVSAGVLAALARVHARGRSGCL